MRSMLRSFTGSTQTPIVETSVRIIAKSNHLENDLLDRLAQFKEEVKCLDIPEHFAEDDFHYMKWLKARGYDIEKGKEMLRNHLNWREDCKYIQENDSILTPQDILDQFKWKRLGNDTKGRPIFCLLGGKVDFKMLFDKNMGDKVKRYMHKSLERIQDACDEQRRLTGYGKAIIIIDMNGFTFSKAMNIELVQLCMYFAKTFEANYPESLYRGLILNANWLFTTLYNAVKPFLAQETVDKMQIHGYDQNKYFPYLEEVVPLELLPEEYGGTGESIEEFEETP